MIGLPNTRVGSMKFFLIRYILGHFMLFIRWYREDFYRKLRKPDAVHEQDEQGLTRQITTTKGDL